MYSNPRTTGQVGGDRQRDMLARAAQQRRAQELRTHAKTAHEEERSERRPGRALRTMARLRTLILHRAR